MHTVFALLCFVVVIHWLIFPYPSGLLHWHCGNLTIAPVPAKQPWWIWINTTYEFIMNDCITTTKQSTTKPCAYFLGYTVTPGHFDGELAQLTHWGRVTHICVSKQTIIGSHTHMHTNKFEYHCVTKSLCISIRMARTRKRLFGCGTVIFMQILQTPCHWCCVYQKW